MLRNRCTIPSFKFRGKKKQEEMNPSINKVPICNPVPVLFVLFVFSRFNNFLIVFDTFLLFFFSKIKKTVAPLWMISMGISRSWNKKTKDIFSGGGDCENLRKNVFWKKMALRYKPVQSNTNRYILFSLNL